MLQRLFKPTAWVIVLILVAHSASAERKALVIGNADYTDKPLTNPAHDAEDMARKLDALGFTVTKVKDADKRQFIDRLEAFRASLNPDDDAVIYYAGHGAQFAGLNYLAPVNAAIYRDEDLETEAVELKRVLNALGPVQNGLKLVIIDACRNNPYPGSHRSGTRGLARVDGIPNQTLLWFAASPGEEANDGRGRNSPFTEHLLRNLDKPGLKAEDVFKQVSRAVIAATQNTNKQQHPYPEGQTLVDFYFAAAPVDATPEPSPVVIPKPTPVMQSPPPTSSVTQTQSPSPTRPQTDSVLKTESVYGIEMVNIPSGTFQMGCGPKDGECSDNEKPRHAVTVPAFAMAKTEITQGQWKAVMGSAPPDLYFKNCGEDCPVERVSWDDVQAFIKTLNQQTGGHYRLPSEAEWEYACRAGQDTLYCGGNDLDAVAWYGENSGKTTQPVRGKQPNHFGLYDMSGNVWEWVQDCYHDNYQGAPGGGSAWDGGTNCAVGRRVLRGGAFYNSQFGVRCAYRYNRAPVNRYNSHGFRIVVSPL